MGRGGGGGGGGGDSNYSAQKGPSLEAYSSDYYKMKRDITRHVDNHQYT